MLPVRSSPRRGYSHLARRTESFVVAENSPNLNGVRRMFRTRLSECLYRLDTPRRMERDCGPSNMEEDARQHLDLVVAATLTLLGLIIGFSFSMVIS